MGFFDRSLESYFKTNSNGEMLFFPWGPMSRGYIVPSEEIKTSLKMGWCKFIQRSLHLVFVLSIAFGLLMDFKSAYWALGAVLGIYYSVYYFSVKKVTRGLQLGSERMRFRDSSEHIARNMSWPVLIFMSLIGIASAIGIGIRAFGDTLQTSHFLLIALLIVLVPLYYFAIRLKLRHKSEPRNQRQTQ